MSAGAVYRCSSGKGDLIAAIAGRRSVASGRRSRASRVDPPPTPDVLIGRVVRTLFAEGVDGGRGLDRRAYAGLIVQVWSEALRSDRLAPVPRPWRTACGVSCPWMCKRSVNALEKLRL
ncbi:hypothetical protein [Streptomyces sp. NPDC048445]|uniref:hypothetical protein n=1 Tax=Streptomyces sp. NPDC048445 TaxID=3365553 RepID=UPI00372179F5